MKNKKTKEFKMRDGIFISDYKRKCTTCAEQCANNEGGLPYEDGCLCNDGKFIKCKKKDQ